MCENSHGRKTHRRKIHDNFCDEIQKYSIGINDEINLSILRKFKCSINWAKQNRLSVELGASLPILYPLILYISLLPLVTISSNTQDHQLRYVDFHFLTLGIWLPLPLYQSTFQLTICPQNIFHIWIPVVWFHSFFHKMLPRKFSYTF